MTVVRARGGAAAAAAWRGAASTDATTLVCARRVVCVAATALGSDEVRATRAGRRRTAQGRATRGRAARARGEGGALRPNALCRCCLRMGSRSSAPIVYDAT
eukprot:5738353-Prymnesium_polylepis.1